MKTPFLSVVMTGLPARGKSTVAYKPRESLRSDGIRRGWGGLLEFNRDDPGSRATNALDPDRVVVRTIDRTGGTFLHSGRTNPGRVRTKNVPAFLCDPGRPEAGKEDEDLVDFTPHVLKNLEHPGIEILIPIGGDDTLSYGERLVALRGGNHIHVPMNTVTGGTKRVDVDELYDVKEYRPKVRHVLGKPMFLS